MRTFRWLFAIGAVLALVVAVADEPPRHDRTEDSRKADPRHEDRTANDDADSKRDVEILAKAMVDAEVELTDLLERVSDEDARTAIRRAIVAARAGRERAVRALQDVNTPDVDVEAGAEARQDTSADLAGYAVRQRTVAKARVAIKSSSEERDRAIKDAIRKSDRLTRRAIKETRDRVRSTTHVALATLDRIIIDRPERIDVSTSATAAAGVRLDHR